MPCENIINTKEDFENIEALVWKFWNNRLREVFPKQMSD